MIILPKDLVCKYSARLQDLIRRDEVLGSLEIAELLAVLAVTGFSYGVSQGQSLSKKEK